MEKKKLIGFIITAGHLDIEWYQPMRSYRFWTMETFEALKEAAARDDFISYILDGQVFPLEEYLEVEPEEEAYLRGLIKKGKLAIGPFYTQFDEWLPSAENMIRNCLYGKRKAGAFGGYMRAGYLPDNFGHPLQLPQILQGFGIDSLLFMRGLPEISGDHPDEFIYRGLDGSEVLVSHFRESYAGAFDIFNKKIDPSQPRIMPYYDGEDSYLSFEHHKELADHDDPQRIAKSLISNVLRIRNRYPSGVIPLIAGFDHLPPQINIGDSVKAANSTQDEIEFVMGTVEDYIRLVYKRINKPAVYNMELLGSRYQYVLLGALSTRTYLKRENFACEALMEKYAEPLEALASRYGYKGRPGLIDEAWRYLMINSAHDSIHGSSVDEVHREMEFRFAAVRQIASGLTHEALAWWGKHTDRWWEKTPDVKSKTSIKADHGKPGVEFSPRGILTYAPVDANFVQPAELWLPVGDSQAVIRDRDGRILPTQILSRKTIELNGQGQPRNDPFPPDIFRRVLFLDTFKAMSVNSHVVTPGRSGAKSTLKTGENFIENEFLRAEVHGGLLDIYDKKQKNWRRNLNLIEEDADAGDAWDYSPAWVPGEIVRSGGGNFTCRPEETGPVRASLVSEGVINVPAALEGDLRSATRTNIPLRFTIMVYAEIPRVDVRLEIENTAKDHRLRLRLSPNIKTNCIRSQGHLAVIDRPVKPQVEIEPWIQPPTQLFPFREWLAVQDGETGLCLAVKGLYDYEAVMNPLTGCPEIALTLLRCTGLMGRLNTMQRKGGVSPAVATPEAQCLGPHKIEWSYIPYPVEKDDKAPFISSVNSFLYPPVSHMVRSQNIDGVAAKAEGISWKGGNIQFSAFKRSIDRKSWILRIFENQGKPAETEIEVPGFDKAWLSNLGEEQGEELHIRGGRIKLTVGAYKAVTLMLGIPEKK